MARKQRECYLCGESYKYCGNCSNDRMKPAWMSEFHSESCKNIFDLCTRFNMNLITKEEAKLALQQCDLSNRANFKPYVQRDLDNIFTEEKVVEPEVVVEATPVRSKAKNKLHEVVTIENE